MCLKILDAIASPSNRARYCIALIGVKASMKAPEADEMEVSGDNKKRKKRRARGES
ncbi:MAG: hypothetical protein LBT01_05575 [Spirochaetaceae bacterium]|nr:hypothetical protein [Spirochaetaceae bacterium]